MNTKYLLSTVLVFLATLGDAFPQSISIELSIEWTKGQDILNEDSLIVYPELTITYRNNSDTSYYFPKIYEDYDHFPSLPCAALWNVPVEDYLHPDYEKKALPPKDYPYSKYFVYIGDGNPVYEPQWEAVIDTILWEEERCSDVVNDIIKDVYTYLRYKLYGDNPNFRWQQRHPKLTKRQFEPEDFQDGKLSDSIIHKFVFLPPNSSCSDKFSLIGFWTLGVGKFTFKVWYDMIPEYVTGYSYEKDLPMFREKKFPLPENVNGYQLYSGKFHSNTVSIDMRK